MSKNLKKQREVEELVAKINQGTFNEEDIKKLLAEMRELANSKEIRGLVRENKDIVITEAYEYLMDVMHGAYAHNLRDRGPMYQWMIGKIGLMQDIRKGRAELTNYEHIELGEDVTLNGFVIDERIIHWFQIVIEKYLVDTKSNLTLDKDMMGINRNDILLCILCIMQTNEIVLPNDVGKIKLYLYSMPTINMKDPKGYSVHVELWGDLFFQDKPNGDIKATTLGVSKTVVENKWEKILTPTLQTGQEYPNLIMGNEFVMKEEYERVMYKAIRDENDELVLLVIS